MCSKFVAYMLKIIFDLEIDLLTLRMTSNHQCNKGNRFFTQNPLKKMHLVGYIKSDLLLLDLEIDLLALKMTYTH